MVAATTFGHFDVAGGSATPIKRPVHQASIYPVAKKHRSYDGGSVEGMKRAFTENNFKSEHSSSIISSPQLVKIERDELPMQSESAINSTPLKSSLKSGGATNLPSNITESPSEGDKRGMYSEFVQGALDDRARGRDSTYQELVAQFRPPSSSRRGSSAPSINLLQMLLHSLSSVASRLDRRNHTPLVDNILTLPWATMGGDSFARVWMRFVCTLCSARNEWIGEVLTRAVKGLSYRSDWRSLAYMPPGPSISRPTRRAIYARIHTLLRSLLSLIPTLPTQLAPLVLQHFPHKREGIKEHIVYIRNMFILCEYANELRSGVLDCVLGRCVEIDVEIQMDLDELEDAEEDMEDDAINDEEDQAEVDNYLDLFDKPLEDEDEDDQSEGDNWEEGLGDIQSDDEVDQDMSRAGTQGKEKIAEIRKLVNKLDAIMETTFNQLEITDTRYLRACKGLNVVEPSLTPARAISLRNDQFGELINIFTKTLLPTFKSRHVQFILFWFSSLDQDYSDLFLGLLLSKAIYGSVRGEEDPISTSSEEVPMIMRVASASYVASLVSRAKYINKWDARIVILNLCAFLKAHLDAHTSGHLINEAHMQRMDDSTVVGPHSLFYAVCQACFYIFCFRWRDLQVKGLGEEEEGEMSELEDLTQDHLLTIKWCDGLDVVKRAIMSNLNPLANCSPAVAEQFAGVAQLTGFLYCWSLIEKNSRKGTAPFKSNSNRSSLNSTAASSSSQSDSKDGNVTPVEASKQHSKLSNSMINSAATRRELDSFFPFDPYRLRASTKWIEPLYREWSDVAPQGMLDEDEEEEDDEKGGEEEEEEEEEIGSEASGSASDEEVQRSNRNALKIPKSKRLHHHHREGFTPSSSSTNEDQIAKSLNSLEAMSISPLRARAR